MDSVRYSVEAEKYRAAAGYMASSGLGGHNLYPGGSVDPVTAAAAAAKYLESSKFNESQKNFLPDLNKGLNDNSAYGSQNGGTAASDANNSSTNASKAYLETAKLYEAQRAYMDAAKSYAEKCEGNGAQSAESDNSGAKGIDGRHGLDGNPSSNSSPSVSFTSQSLANYQLYGQAAAAAAAAGVGQAGNGALPAGLSGAQPLSGIVPLSLSQYASPTGTYPSSGEYRRPLPVIF